jgi:hypothetical protein
LELRFYTLINFYLSSIQQGIQSAHLVHELLLRYMFASTGAAKLAFDWAQGHKTIIVLNGGDNEALLQARMVLEAQHQYPTAFFRESERSLEGVLTGVGVVLPESVFNCTIDKCAVGDPVFIRPSGEEVKFGDTDWPIINLIKSKGLAR